MAYQIIQILNGREGSGNRGFHTGTDTCKSIRSKNRVHMPGFGRLPPVASMNMQVTLNDRVQMESETLEGIVREVVAAASQGCITATPLHGVV